MKTVISLEYKGSKIDVSTSDADDSYFHAYINGRLVMLTGYLDGQLIAGASVFPSTEEAIHSAKHLIDPTYEHPSLKD